MYARSSQTAYARWNFPKALSGHYKIEVVLPSGLPANPNRCPSFRYVTDAVYNLKKGNSTLRSYRINHSTRRGRTTIAFIGNMTGVTAVTVGNKASQTNCGMIMLDQIIATPQ